MGPTFPKTGQVRYPANWFPSSLSAALCPYRQGWSLNSASPSPRVSLCSKGPTGVSHFLLELGEDEYSPGDPVLGLVAPPWRSW